MRFGSCAEVTMLHVNSYMQVLRCADLTGSRISDHRRHPLIADHAQASLPPLLQSCS